MPRAAVLLKMTVYDHEKNMFNFIKTLYKKLESYI